MLPNWLEAERFMRELWETFTDEADGKDTDRPAELVAKFGGWLSRRTDLQEWHDALLRREREYHDRKK